MKEFLNDLELEKVKVFVEDPVMFEAVRKVLLSGIYQNGTLKPGQKANPSKNFALSLAFDPKVDNEALGADLRASASGIHFVELGFRELEKLVPQPIKSPLQQEENPAL